MSDIDHKEQALNLLASIHLETGDVYDQTLQSRTLRLGLAQVHADLYSAEQQRLGNLIARLNGLLRLNPGEKLTPAGRAEADVLEGLICEGLGSA